MTIINIFDSIKVRQPPTNSAQKARELAGTANGCPSLYFYFGDIIMNDIVNIISSVGFPIAMSLLLFWYLQKETENHKEETAGLKDAITKLELAITSLINKLEE